MIDERSSLTQTGEGKNEPLRLSNEFNQAVDDIRFGTTMKFRATVKKSEVVNIGSTFPSL